LAAVPVLRIVFAAVSVLVILAEARFVKIPSADGLRHRPESAV
jgi:hypothetical protein